MPHENLRRDVKDKRKKANEGRGRIRASSRRPYGVTGAAAQERVSKKISHLRGEGKPQAEAVATALSMEKLHRLSETGKYVPVRK